MLAPLATSRAYFRTRERSARPNRERLTRTGSDGFLVAVVAPGSPTDWNDLRDIYVRTQTSEDGVGDAAVHGEFDVRSDSCAGPR